MTHHTHTTVLRLFFWDYPAEQVPEEIFFWTLWCKGRLPAIRLGATLSGLISDSPPLSPIFTPDALPATSLQLYPGLGQAPHMPNRLACIPSGVVLNNMLD